MITTQGRKKLGEVVTTGLIQQFKDVPATVLFRKLKSVSRNDITTFYAYFRQGTDAVTDESSREIQRLVENYCELAFYIQYRGDADNPYPKDVPDIPMTANEKQLHYQKFPSVESRYNYLLNIYLPKIGGDRYFIIVKYELLNPIISLKSAVELILLGSDMNEIFPEGVPIVRDLEATIHATADYEKQLFG